jgi:hypothetical protein
MMHDWTSKEFKKEIWRRILKVDFEPQAVAGALKVVAIAIVYLAECVKWQK